MPEKQNTQDGDKRPDVVSLSGQPDYRTDAGSVIETLSRIESILTPDGYVNVTDPYDEEGLTKREYFAVMAMQGLLACPVSQLGPQGEIPSNAAEAAVRYADALIEALNKALNEPITDEPEKDLPF